MQKFMQKIKDMSNMRDKTIKEKNINIYFDYIKKQNIILSKDDFEQTVKSFENDIKMPWFLHKNDYIYIINNPDRYKLYSPSGVLGRLAIIYGIS